MKHSWCALALAAVIAGAACSAAPARIGLVPAPRFSKQTVRVRVGGEKGAVRAIRLEDYVRAAILSEFAPPDGDPALVGRMLQVQAVIARTYALSNRGRHARQGFDLCATTHCQLFEPGRVKTSRWAPQAIEAVRQTAGAILLDGAVPAAALFHSDCGGHTSTSTAAWGGSVRRYLVAAPDDGPARDAHVAWTYSVPAGTLAKALNADPRTRVGRRLDTISVVARDVSGRADTVALEGERKRLVKGEELRAVLTRQFGARSLKSTLFEVHRERAVFVFSGRGFGHGVGLCQVGALARLRAGATPADVLRRYYPGTALGLVN